MGLFDKIFNIPSDVLITFAFFGLGGRCSMYLYMVQWEHLCLRQRILTKVPEVYSLLL